MQSAFCRQAKNNGAGNRHTNTTKRLRATASSVLPSSTSGGSRETTRSRSSLLSTRLGNDSRNTTKRPYQQLRFQQEDPSQSRPSGSGTDLSGREGLQGEDRIYIECNQNKTAQIDSSLRQQSLWPQNASFCQTNSQVRPFGEYLIGPPQQSLLPNSKEGFQTSFPCGGQSVASAYAQKPPQASVTFPNNYMDGLNMSQLSGLSQEQGSYCYDPSFSAQGSSQFSAMKSNAKYAARPYSQSSAHSEVFGSVACTSQQYTTLEFPLGCSTARQDTNSCLSSGRHGNNSNSTVSVGAQSLGNLSSTRQGNHSEQSLGSTVYQGQQSGMLQMTGMESSQSWRRNAPLPQNPATCGVLNPFQTHSKAFAQQILEPAAATAVPLSRDMQGKIRALVESEVRKTLRKAKATAKNDQQNKESQKLAFKRLEEAVEKTQEAVRKTQEAARKSEDAVQTTEVAVRKTEEAVQKAEKLEETVQKIETTVKEEIAREIGRLSQCSERAKQEIRHSSTTAKDHAVGSIALAAESTLAKIATAGTDLLQSLVPHIKHQVTKIVGSCLVSEIGRPNTNKPDKDTSDSETSISCSKGRDRAFEQPSSTTCPTRNIDDTTVRSQPRRSSNPPTRSQTRRSAVPKEEKAPSKKRAKISPLKPLEIVKVGSTQKRYEMHSCPEKSLVSPLSQDDSRDNESSNEDHTQTLRSGKTLQAKFKSNRTRKTRASQSKRSFEDMSGFLCS
ncbi:hypothetical protein ACA910_022128 [Epithemia clementina (nom. ined.)]